MTMIERVASAISASRNGTTAGWECYRGDALRLIAATRGFPSLREPALREIKGSGETRAG
ncbi:hypothetical protein [Sphingomonas hengshuiensis]|uniref:Uncharacterized protein n=1 Tax=Sphingomonas hengshuiensis TaxID=1609977 RepID=A0A7U4J9F0_9SPHN|nr:hypothetical protein [Sphingomonas hengshuiensis]AJP72678.1 hypothetical protein TS85_14180 [Sphingomonas hengshuiensis]